MRGDGGEHEHQRLHCRLRYPVQALGATVLLGEEVGVFDELGDGGVVSQVAVLFANSGHSAVQVLSGFVVQHFVGGGELAGVLVDGQAPDALQEAVGADDVFGGPGAGLVERAHAHLVDAQGVGTVGVTDFVGADGVLEGLAHLAVFAVDLQLLTHGHAAVLGDQLGRFGGGPDVAAIAFFYFGGGHVGAAFVGVGEGLDVALVEELAVGFGGAQVAQVEEDLVPEAAVEQVQDGVFDATHVEVDAAQVLLAVLFLAGAHPVFFVADVAEDVLVSGVDVAQLVPGGAGPLGHDVGVAGVGLEAVTQVEFNVDPIGGFSERRAGDGVGVVGGEADGLVVLHFGQLDGEHAFGEGVG